MHYLVARFDMLVTQGRSLKEKRAVVQRLKARLAQRLTASVSEVDHQDVHQRTALGMALVVHRDSSGREALAAARGVIEQEPSVTVLEVRFYLGKLEDDSRATWQDLGTPAGGAGSGHLEDSGAFDPDSDSDEPDPDDEFFA